ncbi:unnamed protein product [Rhizoctonia solani]|uniref:Uncharacterized protein n=1 Tax=Rhizoctonia solani TaxID=456999 RepID=A0A8H3CFP3_9AGAM|nr:unnamed protein product [Rhizoctonia solani]
MLTESQPTKNMEFPTKPHPYLNQNLSSTTFHTSVSSFTHFAPTFPSHSQSSLGHSIKARYPDPYSDNPFLPLKELRRLRSTEILNAKTPMMEAVLDDEDEFLGDEMSALAEPHTPGLTPDSTASEENLANVDFSPTSSTEALPYTSYFARTQRSRSCSLDSDGDGLYTPTQYQTAVLSDVLSDSPGNDGPGHAKELDEYSDTEKDVPEPVEAPNPSTPSRKRPPPIQVENQEPRSTTSSPGKASTFITVDEEEEDDVVESPRPRSVKLSAASAFSLSLFPPTPTTPMNRQSWVRNSRASIDSTSFSPARHSLGGPVAFSTPRHTAPSTPTRRAYRATMEIDRPRRSEVLFRPGRASVDAFHSCANTSSGSSYSQTTDSASFYSGGPSTIAPSRLRESSYMQSDSAFETCAESVSPSRTSKDVLSQSCEDMLSTRVLPPTRKPVPRVDSELIEMNAKSRVSLPDPVPASTSPTTTSVTSINSTFVQSKPKTKKKKKGRKLVIGHPHMNDESSRTTLSNMTLPIGPKVTHSDSLGSLRDELLGNASSLGMLAKAKAKRSKKAKKPCQPFDKSGLPSEDQLKQASLFASNMYVYDETSRPIRFGDIFKDQKTAICFIRHFWCPLCQDYMSSIVHLTEPSLVQKAGVKLVIIGNGSPSMIKSYKTDIFHCPYEMYTDPERKVYNALGMTLRTNDGGSEEDKGSYVKHGTFTGTMMVMKRALKMPLANAGDIKQLGGEFILGPGLNCSFASRMHTTRSHTPIRDLLQAAGVSMNPSATKLSILGSPADSARWTDAQNEDMDNMIRKGLRASCGGDNCPLDAGQDFRQDLGEFRRLIERLKDQGSESESEPVCQPTSTLSR